MRFIFGHYQAGNLWLNMIFKRLFPHVAQVMLGQIVRYGFDERDFFYFNMNTIASMKVDEEDKAVHIIRDPRDVAISAYFAHLEPAVLWGQLKKHSEKLQTLSQNEGILCDMAWTAAMPHPISSQIVRTFEGFRAFSADPHVAVLRYEFMQSEPITSLLMAFEAIEMKVDKGKVIMAIDEVMRSVEDRDSPLDVSVEWRAYMNEEARRRFRTLTGDLSEALGYEGNPDW